MCNFTEVIVGEYAVRRVGNSPRASTAGVDAPGAAFLLPESFQKDGVVFAFAAYYRNINPVRFQLWRPVEATESGEIRSPETTVQLVSQLSVIPSVEDSRETVCIRWTQLNKLDETSTHKSAKTQVGNVFGTRDPLTFVLLIPK